MREPEWLVLVLINQRFQSYPTNPFSWETDIHIAYREDGYLVCSYRSELCCAIFPVTFQDQHISQNQEVRDFSGGSVIPKKEIFFVFFVGNHILEVIAYCK